VEALRDLLKISGMSVFGKVPEFNPILGDTSIKYKALKTSKGNKILVNCIVDRRKTFVTSQFSASVGGHPHIFEDYEEV
jgi:hypothetical protein